MSDDGAYFASTTDVEAASNSSVRPRTKALEHHQRRPVRDLRPSAFPRPAGAPKRKPPDAAIGAVLAQEHLVAQLQREMRRSDRSKAPLSLAIFRLEKPDASVYRLTRLDAGDCIVQLRLLLARRKRETDILGELATGVFAIIFPDTGEKGVRRFVEKIDHQANGMPYSAEAATYPDDLFEGLIDTATTCQGPGPLLLGRSGTSLRDTYFLKRPMDIVGATLALILLSPLMLVTALAVKMSSPGPIIFRQTRLGKGGTPFNFYKFRSMFVGGNDQIHREFVAKLIKGEHEKINQQDATAPMYKIKVDPRVTWVGRVIRKTSIDELPQLFNVLKGEMSLVGPRPPLPYEAQDYQSWHLRRVLDIKPGLTGLWQVEGRSKVGFDEMVRMDLRYVRGCSLGLDLRIMVKTVSVVLNCKGAS